MRRAAVQWLPQGQALPLSQTRSRTVHVDPDAAKVHQPLEPLVLAQVPCLRAPPAITATLGSLGTWLLAGPRPPKKKHLNPSPNYAPPQIACMPLPLGMLPRRCRAAGRQALRGRPIGVLRSPQLHHVDDHVAWGPGDPFPAAARDTLMRLYADPSLL